MKDKIKENSEKIKVNKTLPYLVSNVIEVCVYVEGKRVWKQPAMGHLEKEWVEVVRPKPHDGLPLLGPLSQCAFPRGDI